MTTMSDKHRAELITMLAEQHKGASRWDRYGIALLQMGLRPEANAWTVWQAVTGIASASAKVDEKGERDGPGDLARLAAMFGAALVGDEALYEEHAQRMRDSYPKRLAAALASKP